MEDPIDKKAQETPDNRLKRLEMDEYINLWWIKDKVKSNKDDILNDFDTYLHVNYSYNTYVNYSYIIKKFFRTLELSKLNPKINGYQIYNFLQGKRMPSHAAIKIFLNYCKIKLRKTFNDLPMPKIKTSKNKIVEVLTQKQVITVINEMPKRYKFLTEFIYTLGLRFSESLEINVNNFNWSEWSQDKSKNGYVIIKETKSTSERKIPIKKEFMFKIFDFVKDRDGSVRGDSLIFFFNFVKYKKKRIRKEKKKDIKIFETFMKRDYFEEILKKDFHFKIYKNFNVTFSSITKELFKKRSTSHILRKSRATFLLKNNMPIIQVKDFLGHKKLETTMRYLASEYEDLNKSIMVIGDIS